MIVASLDLAAGWAAGNSHGRSDADKARDGLLIAGLTSRAALRSHLFSDDGTSPVRSLAMQRLVDSHRIELKSLALLPALADSSDYLFLSVLGQVSRLSLSRRRLGLRLPICVALPTLPPDVAIGAAVDLMCCKEQDAVVVPTKSLRAALGNLRDNLRACEFPVPHTPQDIRIEVIPPPVDISEFHPRDKQQCRETLGLPVDRVVIGVPGDLARGRKAALEPFVFVLQEVARRHPKALAVIVDRGEPGYKADLQATVHDMRMSDHVVMLTSVPSQNRPILWSASDLVVCLDDRIDSAAASTIVEVLATGVPIVASHWHGADELIHDGQDGVLVPTLWNPVAEMMLTWLAIGSRSAEFVADRTIIDTQRLFAAVEGLVSNAALRAQLGEAARARAVIEYGLQAVGTAVTSLWDEQLARAAVAGVRTPVAAIAATADSATFATSSVSLETVMSMGSRLEPILRASLQAVRLPSVPALLRADAERLAKTLEQGRFTVGAYVESSASQFALEAIVWMARRGYVQLGSAQDSR